MTVLANEYIKWLNLKSAESCCTSPGLTRVSLCSQIDWLFPLTRNCGLPSWRLSSSRSTSARPRLMSSSSACRRLYSMMSRSNCRLYSPLSLLFVTGGNSLWWREKESYPMMSLYKLLGTHTHKVLSSVKFNPSLQSDSRTVSRFLIFFPTNSRSTIYIYI